MYKLVLVARKDLKMSAGKLAAQCGHAVLSAVRKTKRKEVLEIWRFSGEPIVVLKCRDLEQLMKIKHLAEDISIITSVVKDAGLTQVEPGSITVLALGVSKTTLLDKICKNLKLY